MTDDFNNHEIDDLDIVWADSILESFMGGYDEFAIRIREDSGGVKVLRCLGYVGFQIVGFWDDTIVETAKVHADHKFITECELRLKNSHANGSKWRVSTGNRLLEVVFIDGCKLWVCVKHFRVGVMPNKA